MSRVIRPVRNLQKKRHTRRLGDIGGSGEIRTHDGRKPTPVFKSSDKTRKINRLGVIRFRNAPRIRYSNPLIMR